MTASMNMRTVNQIAADLGPFGAGPILRKSYFSLKNNSACRLDSGSSCPVVSIHDVDSEPPQW